MQKKEFIDSFADKQDYQKLVGMINPKKLVYVYKNLHTDLWSVMQSDRVLFHCNYIVLANVAFVVRPAGRARVLKEKKKYVHAFVKGNIVNSPAKIPNDKWCEVGYNPYRGDSFYNKELTQPIYKARYVDMLSGDSDIFGPNVMAIC